MQAPVSRSIEPKTLWMMTGLLTFSSKLPRAPATATAVSLPSTWMQTIIMASLWVGLTLPGMIEDPGSLAGSTSSPSPLRGPEPSQRMSSAILVERAGQRAKGGARPDERVVRGEGGELVGGGHEGQPGQLGDLGGHPLGELGVRVEPGADGRAPGGQLVEAGEGLLEAPEVGVELGDVARELLAQREGDGVHQVGPADLGHLVERLGLLCERVAQRAAPRGSGGG